MHLLVISLVIILTGTLLLAKFKKDLSIKFFTWVSWFFFVVGVILFLGFIGDCIDKVVHHDLTSRSCIQHEMMWKNWHYRMAAGCMSHDSTMKCCSKRMTGDTTKMPAPKK
ncbi:MAG: hypothetical protein ABSD71_14500 [Bacteroidales bacterium]